MSDNGSLQNLNDIVLPAAIGWWPLTPAWYLLTAVLLLLALWSGWLWWRRWQANRYRRRALRSLQALRVIGGSQALQQIPDLLKRTALSCWPRTEVAALSGRRWHEFLDRSSAGDHFCSGAGVLLERLAYDSGNTQEMGESESAAVFAATEFWLRRHRPELAPVAPC